MSCRNNNVGGDSGRRWPNGEVSPGGGSSERCECVFECLLQLLEDAGNSNNHCCHRNSVSQGVGANLERRCDCECVFECLTELLEGAQEEEENHCWRRSR